MTTTGMHVVSQVCECGRVATHGVFCPRCWNEYSSLCREYDEREQRRRSPVYQLRVARRRQFFAALIVMLIGEGLWDTAIGLPVDFLTVGLSLGFALAVASVAALMHGRKSGGK